MATFSYLKQVNSLEYDVNFIRVSIIASIVVFASNVYGQSPLQYDDLNHPKAVRHSPNIAQEHHSHDDRSRHHESDRHNQRYRDPWRWGLGWNNHWGPSLGIGWSNGYGRYWRDPFYNDWRYPYDYRYQRIAQPKRVEPVAIAPPVRTTTSIAYDSGLRHLPENAKVIQQDGKMLYEWQGKRYRFDWDKEIYVVVE